MAGYERSYAAVGSVSCQLLADELDRTHVGFRNFPGVAVTEAVFGSRDGEEFMFHAMLCQLTGHVGGAGVGNVGVLCPVNHQDRRIVARNLFHRAESVERARFLNRVDAGDSQRPTAGLSQETIVAAASFPFSGIVGVRQDSLADRGASSRGTEVP